MKAGRPLTPEIGIIEWFTPGDHEHVERVLSDARILGVDHLRTGVWWSDLHNPSSDRDEWYSWLFHRLSRQVHVLPCFVGTPQ